MAPLVLYITGFRQHAGKTVTSLGILSALRKHIDPKYLGYIKPVGQELLTLPDGTKIDKDARIIERFSGIPDLDMKMVSPVRLGSGFTKSFLDSGEELSKSKELVLNIKEAFKAMDHKKVIVAEGTGHPGVGGIVGLSNARVSNLIGANTIFLSGGGIGKALDQIEVDLTYFIHNRSNVRGLIFNKLIPNKLDQVKHYINEELLNRKYGPYFKKKLEVFGYLPQLDDLNNPSMDILRRTFKGCETFGAPVGTYNWEIPLNRISVISLLDKYLHLEKYLHKGDVILIGVGSKKRLSHILKYNKEQTPENRLGGLILTCGENTELDKENRHVLKSCEIPTLYVKEDTAEAESMILKAYQNTKLQPYDDHKVAEIEDLFEKHFDVDKFIKTFNL